MLTNSKQYNIFGIDISDLSIKLVQLKGTKGKSKIQAIGKYRLKEGILDNGVIIDKKALVEAVRTVSKKPVFGSITTKNIVASLPENKVFIKSFRVEKSPNLLKDMIIPKMEANIPYPLDDIYYDWQITEQKRSEYQVLVAATPKPIVDSYLDVFHEAGLKVMALETESMAVCRCSLVEESINFKDKSTKTYGLIDIGSKRTTMTIYSRNTIVLAMSIEVSADSATETIANTLQIHKNQAEKAKIICGLDKEKAEGIIADILSEMINKMIDRIKQIILFFEDNYPHLEKIDEIFISGGGANIKDLDKIIDTELEDIKVSQTKAFTNLEDKMDSHSSNFTETHDIDIELIANKKKGKKSSKRSTISSKQNSSLGYVTAIGLALRNKFD